MMTRQLSRVACYNCERPPERYHTRTWEDGAASCVMFACGSVHLFLGTGDEGAILSPCERFHAATAAQGFLELMAVDADVADYYRRNAYRRGFPYLVLIMTDSSPHKTKARRVYADLKDAVDFASREARIIRDEPSLRDWVVYVFDTSNDNRLVYTAHPTVPNLKEWERYH